jgi:hypothetical protein
MVMAGVAIEGFKNNQNAEAREVLRYKAAATT